MQGEPNYSGQIAYEIDKEVQRIIKEQYERCKQILLEHESQLKLIAKTLLTEETLVAEQIRSLFYDGVLPTVDYDAAKVVKMKIEMILSSQTVNMVNLMMTFVKNNLKKVVKMKQKTAEKITESIMIETIIVQTVINLKIIHNEMIVMKQVMNNLQI